MKLVIVHVCNMLSSCNAQGRIQKMSLEGANYPNHTSSIHFL